MTLRVRALDVSGDSTFGRGAGSYLVDTPAAVGQKIQQRLGLYTGEWFLDKTEGTPWNSQVVTANQASADATLQARVAGTIGVLSILGWWSSVDHVTRLYVAGAVVQTIFGTIVITVARSPGDQIFTINISALDGGDPLG